MMILKYSIRIILLIGVLAVSCVDQIDFEVPAGLSDSIVIQSRVVKGDPSFVEVDVTRLFDFTVDSRRPVNVRTVILTDDNNNEMILETRVPGSYFQVLNASTPIQAEVGRGYKLRVETLDNRIFESSIDIMPPNRKPQSLNLSIVPQRAIDNIGNATEVDKIRFSIGGDLEEFEIEEALSSLPRTNQVSDFHCVTTWSKLNLNWSGYRFNDFYKALILPKVSGEITFVVLKAQDGYKTSLPLVDLMKNNVLLADQLDGEPLTIDHGAPIRIVTPDHYGYKNLKHIKRIEFYAEKQVVKQGYLSFMDHPRARVREEERASAGPGILFRWLYKFGIQGTIKDFEKATAEYRANKQYQSGI